MTQTIGRLAKKFGLSRSTLLYYDAIGLLSPAAKCKGEYRRYDDRDEHRLAQICQYRRTGISLKEISRILDAPDSHFTGILEQRFADLNREIDDLREQQRIIAGLLKNSANLRQPNVMTKELWVSLLADSGFSEEDMQNWHSQFERTAPEKHQRFLQLLQIPEEEIERIRRASRQGYRQDPGLGSDRDGNQAGQPGD